MWLGLLRSPWFERIQSTMRRGTCGWDSSDLHGPRSRVDKKWSLDYKISRPSSCDPLPPARPYFLRDPQPLKPGPLAGYQVLEHMSK